MARVEPGEYVLTLAEPMHVLLGREYGGDAHFVVYYPRDLEDRAAYPRCKKSLLPQLRLHGDDLVGGWLVFDADNPGHVAHASPQSAQHLVDLVWNLDPRPHFAYSTRGGARFGYSLDREVPVDQLEGLLRGLHPPLAAQIQALTPGIKLDGLFDWTRLFRLPKATRDGEPEWEQPWFLLRLDTTGERPVLNPDQLPRGEAFRVEPGAPLRQVDPDAYGPCPTFEESSDLLYEHQTSRGGQTLIQELRRRALGRICYPYLYGTEVLAPVEGPGRSNAIHRYVGDSVRWWYPVAGCTPQLVHALWAPYVMTFEPDSGTPDWLQHLWSAVTRYWARAEEQDVDPGATRSAPSTQDAQIEQDVLGRMADGIERWYPDLPQEPDARHAWILRHLFLIRKRGEIYLLRDDGFYDIHPVDSESLIPAIRDSQLSELVALDYVTPQGTFRPRTAQELVREHGTRIVSRELRVGVWAANGRPGGVIRSVGQDQVMAFSMFRRRALEPAFDSRVDEWLQAFAGDRVELLRAWIAWSLAFEEGPIAALAAVGVSGAGKKMLARGLVECTDPSFHGTGSDFGRFQYGPAVSPWVIVNEGFPSDVSASQRADVFRCFVSGERIRCEVKFQAPYEISVALRVVITANNTGVIEDLAGGKDLSVEDRRAVMSRLCLVYVREEAADLLRERGGNTYTWGWIGGDAGQPSEYVVARHFLWLYQQRHRWPVGKRFLVEGNTDDPELRRALASRSGYAPVVIEAVIQLLENGASDGLEVTADRPVECWVTSHAVLTQCRKLGKQNAQIRVPTLKAVTSILRSFSAAGGFSIQRADHRRWHQLDLPALVVEAEEYGMPQARLQRMVNGLEPGHVPRITSIRERLTRIQGGAA